MKHLLIAVLTLTIWSFPHQLLLWADWPGFRGAGNSHTSEIDLPLDWSDEAGVAWRCTLAGKGQSSPVTANRQVYVTSAGGDRKQHLYLESFDLNSGKQLWKQQFAATQTAEKVTDMISRSAPTPVADRDGVYCFFESGDLFGLDHTGKQLWERRIVTEFGVFVGGHGVGTSLVNTPDHLVLSIDHDGPSYIICIAKSDGKTVWKTERTKRVSWTTPLYIESDGVPQLIVSSNGSVDSYRFSDGQQLWSIPGITKNTVASPTFSGDTIIIGSSNPNDCMAIKLPGADGIAEAEILWRAASVTSSFGSPLVHKGTVYFVNRAGVLQAVNMDDGTIAWQHRLPASTWASPLAAGDRIYCFCKDGKTAVLTPGKSGPGEVVINNLKVEEKDRIYGYAVAQNRFIIRIGQELICVGELGSLP